MFSNVEKAKEKLKENKFSIEAWNVLIKDALEKNVEEARPFFEELIHNFPTCGRFWKYYIEHELKSKNVEEAEMLYERCLSSVLNIDLWKSYLLFLKEYKNQQNDYNKIMIEKFDLALQKVGIDVMSYSIWNDYANFMKSLEPSSENKEELMNSIRKIYQNALKSPMVNIEQIWKEYSLFDSTQVDESSKDFQNIKKISREYENVTRPLERHLPALPPGCMGNEEEETRQLNAWKRYILWEKQNPLKLENQQEIMKRVLYAYEQSFLCLAYHADFWYEASCYLFNQSKLLGSPNENTNTDENVSRLKEITVSAAGKLYERSLKTFMKDNMLIYLAYADFEERRKNFTKVYDIYETCLQNKNIEPTLIWIQYIRFVKRNEDIIAARKLFKRAREDPRSTYHLFIANANLEYFCTKDKAIGFKIFHLGAKKYSNESEYMLAYLKYMSHLNEDNNTRVLFERILSSDELPAVKSNEIWSEFLKFECAVGDLASILKVDKKRQKVYEQINPNESSSNILMIDRYRYLDLLPSSVNELKSMGYKDLPESNGSSITNGANLTNTLKLSSLVNISNLSSIFSNNISLSQSDIAVAAANEIRRMSIPVPDITQMLPFKPVRNPLPGLHSIAGGVFPFPPAVTELVKRLPPPNTFEGPFVKIDEFLNNFQEIDINEDFQPLYVYINGEPIKELDHLTTGLSQAGSTQQKRPLTFTSTSDDEDTKKTKSMDIYKQRQYQKLVNKNISKS